MTDSRSFKILGHRRPRRPIVWFDEIVRRDTLRTGSVALLNFRAMLIVGWPHDNVDVTAEFLAVTGDQADVDETHLAVLEDTR